MDEQFSEFAGGTRSLEGIKRLAKELKRDSLLPIKHHEALENASFSFGFTCYAQAREVLLRGACDDRLDCGRHKLEQGAPRLLPATHLIKRIAQTPVVRVEVRRRRRLSCGPIWPNVTAATVATLRGSKPTIRLIVIAGRRQAEACSSSRQRDSVTGELCD